MIGALFFCVREGREIRLALEHEGNHLCDNQLLLPHIIEQTYLIVATLFASAPHTLLGVVHFYA